MFQDSNVLIIGFDQVKLSPDMLGFAAKGGLVALSCSSI